MNILQIVDERWDSGITNYALSVSEGLVKSGHKVWALVRPGGPAAARCGELGIPVKPARWKDLLSLRSWMASSRIQLINAHTGSAHALALALAAGKPVAVVRTRGDVRLPSSRIGHTIVFDRTQALITAADFIRQQYLRIYPRSGDKIKTIPGGVDTNKFSPRAWPLEPRVGMLARLDPVKGHEDALSAAERVSKILPAARWLLAGADANLKRSDMEKQASRRGWRHVAFLGFVEDSQEFMARSQVGVIASRGSEAVSRALLEWMAAARPVVATGVGCIPEILQDGVTGFLVPPRDPAALANRVAELLRDPGKAEKMGRAARALAEQRYSQAVMVRDTEQVYSRALSLGGDGF